MIVFVLLQVVAFVGLVAWILTPLWGVLIDPDDKE